MKIKELKKHLYEVFPLSLQESYDNCGMTIGNEEKEITNVLVTLDVTEEVIDEAIESDCNVIVAHHPIVFRGLKSFRGDNYVERCVIKAIRHDIAIFAMHTNVDNSENGTSFELAKVLELQDLSPLDTEGDKAVGCIGTYNGTQDFTTHLKEKLKLKVVKCAGTPGKKSEKSLRIGIVTGSGSEFYGTAKARECDVFVSADFKYHQYFDAIDGPMIMDIGHYESEIFAKDVFFREISLIFSKNELTLHKVYRSGVVTNPVRFL